MNTHYIYIYYESPLNFSTLKYVSLRKYAFLLSSLNLFCHHYFNLMYLSDCSQRLPYLSVTELDFFRMVQMKNSHKRKSRLEAQLNNLVKESICEYIHSLHHLSAFSLQIIPRKAETETALQALLLLMHLNCFLDTSFC